MPPEFPIPWQEAQFTDRMLIAFCSRLIAGVAVGTGVGVAPGDGFGVGDGVGVEFVSFELPSVF